MTAAIDPGPRLRVLIVDDNVEGCRALAKFLEISGFAVTVATTGTSAYEAIDAGLAPEFVLTDLLLPDADGREIARRARQLTPPPRIALITGWSLELDIEEAAREFDWILAKPLDMRSLVATLRAATTGDPAPAAP